MSTVAQTKESNTSSCGEVCGITFGGCALFGILGVALYNFIMTIIAIVGFTNDDVEKVCPESQLWWWALFIGVIVPMLITNFIRNKPDDEHYELRIVGVVAWLVMITIFIVWAWDQLWGVPGFANNTCAMDNWATYNSTDNADNSGYKLFAAVKWWMYLYMVIDVILILGICGIGGFLVVGSCFEKKNSGITSTNTNYDATNNV